MRKFKAFTFLEVIFSLLLTSILLGSLLSVIYITRNSVGNIFKVTEIENNLVYFYSLMEEDWFYARQVEENINGISIYKSDQKIVKYTFFNKMIVRELGGGSDTLFVKYLNANIKEQRFNESQIKVLEMNIVMDVDTLPILLMQTFYRKQQLENLK